MRQAIIKFTENLSQGFCNPRVKSIAMYIDLKRQHLDLSDLATKSGRGDFKVTGHKKFPKLKEMLVIWEAMGVGSEICRRFRDAEEYHRWRKTTWFTDSDVHWQLLVEHEDGSWTAYIETGLSFPPALEQIYKLAASMKPSKEETESKRPAQKSFQNWRNP